MYLFLFCIVLTEKYKRDYRGYFYHKVIGAKRTEAVTRRCIKKVFLEISQNSQKNICVRVSFSIWMQEACNFIKKETLAQVFSCKFWEISKNNFLHCFIFFHLAFNAKSFSVGFLVFFLFLLLVTFLGGLPKAFQSSFYIVSYQESVWPRSDSFLGH